MTTKAVRQVSLQSVIDDLKRRNIPPNKWDLSEYRFASIKHEKPWWESKQSRKEYYQMLVRTAGLGKHNPTKRAQAERLHLGLCNTKNWRTATRCNAPTREYRPVSEMKLMQKQWAEIEEMNTRLYEERKERNRAKRHARKAS